MDNGLAAKCRHFLDGAGRYLFQGFRGVQYVLNLPDGKTFHIENVFFGKPHGFIMLIYKSSQSLPPYTCILLVP